MIRLKNISKVFDDGNTRVRAVNTCNLTLSDGEFVAIIGPSGSGKSTLLTIIGALQKPSEGVLMIDDQNVYDLNEKELSRLRFNTLGFVLQGSNLVPYLTIEEQFDMKLSLAKQADEGQKEKLLNILQINDIRNKYPDEVSGGQRQRVAIALALLLKPAILLADEPTASLDTDRAYDVVDLLKRASDEFNTTVIMVTHDKRMLEHCDSVYEMIDGTLSKKEI